MACHGKHLSRPPSLRPLLHEQTGNASLTTSTTTAPLTKPLVPDSSRPLGHYPENVKPRILVIDNYDSFVYIQVQYLGELGADPFVIRNDERSVAEMLDLEPDGVLISPGPGVPEQAGHCLAAIEAFAGQTPVLGICLGHQAIAQTYGAQIVRAPELMHGKTSSVHHDRTGVFHGLPSPMEATRYHSLTVEPDSITDALEVTATTSDGTIMGIRHRHHDVEGIQFHPESVLTPLGKDLLQNFIDRCR